MKNLFIVCTLSFIVYLFGCGDSVTNPVNPPPVSQDSTVILSSPADGFIFHTPDSVTINFQWMRTLGAGAYELQMSGDSLFSVPESYFSADTTYSFTINSCNPTPCYNYWRVRIHNQVRPTQYWSARRSFVIQP